MTLPYQDLRQSTAVLFACALVDLFPDAQLMDCVLNQIGFTYTFCLEQPLEEGVLTLFEEKMRAIAKKDLPFQALDMMRENAEGLFRHRGQIRKAELVAESLYNIVSIAKLGESFYDFALPTLLSSTSEIVAFKLQKLEKVAGDDDIFVVTGTAFPDSKSLKKFLKRVEEAKKRDHRTLGSELQLFSRIKEINEHELSWLPAGAFLKETLKDWWRKEHLAQRFLPVSTPRVVKNSVLKKYSASSEGEDLHVIKLAHGFSFADTLEPLHALLFRSTPHTIQDLPVRYSEWAEMSVSPSVASDGLFQPITSNVGLTNTFCSEEQVLTELISSLRFIEKTVNMLGLEYQWTLLSRGHKFAGTIAKWDKTLEWMTSALQECKCSYTVEPSDRAFNGPRIILRMKDALGREWDGSFIGIDLNQPERFSLSYRGADGKEHTPYMIVRSMFGSLERCIAVLIEHCSGVFPLWLSPEQVRLLPVKAAQHSYADEVCRLLVEAGIRCRVDYRQDPLGAKVHAVQREKIPYALVLGEAEEKNGVVNVRSCYQQGETKRMKLGLFLHMLQEEAGSPLRNV